MRIITASVLFVAFIAISSLPNHASADDGPTGNKYFSTCENSRGAEKDACMVFLGGYIQGFYIGKAISLSIASDENVGDTWSTSDPPPCPPHDTKTQQAYDVLMNYLRAHPESRQADLSTLTWIALSQAWPCKSPFEVKNANDKDALRGILASMKLRPQPLCIGSFCMFWKSTAQLPSKP
ncbi:MAG: Rap1a/Tai family immunity protein [Alphaproteobacteria bacterium]|nr:Rap1a/Tai family immunity protein [Alphaproteobacteria bacterium]